MSESLPPSGIRIPGPAWPTIADRELGNVLGELRALADIEGDPEDERIHQLIGGRFGPEAFAQLVRLDRNWNAAADRYRGELGPVEAARFRLRAALEALGPDTGRTFTASDIEAARRELDEEAEALRKLAEMEERAKALPVFSLEAERLADIPPRPWWFFFTVGLNLITAKKGIGKTLLVFAAAYAIASGSTFLGRRARKSRVLLILTEIDRLGAHERAQRFGPAPEGLDVAYEWTRGDAALFDLEAIIRSRGYRVVFIDMLQGILPFDLDSNSYESGHLFNALRRLAQRLGVAIVVTWHSVKAARDDYVDLAMGSTALVAQSDVILVLERERGSDYGKLKIAGNHAAEEILSIHLDGLRWELSGDGETDREARVSESERAILNALGAAPAGLTAASLAGTLGKAPASIRAWLSRLGGRGLVAKVGPAWFNTERNAQQSEIFAHVAEGQPGATAQRNATAPLGGLAVLRSAEPRENEKEDPWAALGAVPSEDES